MGKARLVISLLIIILLLCAVYYNMLNRKEFKIYSLKLASTKNEIALLKSKLEKYEDAQKQMVREMELALNDLGTIRLEKLSQQMELKKARKEVEVLQREVDAESGERKRLKEINVNLSRNFEKKQSENSGLSLEISRLLNKNDNQEAYAAYLEILLQPFWVRAGIPPRFLLQDVTAWKSELLVRAKALNDQQLLDYLVQQNDEDLTAYYRLWYHCLSSIQGTQP